MAIFKCFGVNTTRRKRLSSVSDAISVLENEGFCEDGYDAIGSMSIQTCNIDGKSIGVRKFRWEEMHIVTMNFLNSRVIGYGGFSTVYLANFSDSSLGAIKMYSSSSERLSRIYKQELEILLKLKHEHIVKLLGYCDDKDEGILVFEYISNGTLQEKLHGGNGKKGGKHPTLSWKNRMIIAYQLALALEYLHEKCSVQIVHGDIKASNILVDEELNCKLCDFGSAKLGFSSAVVTPSSRLMNQMMLGSPGYTDPHYMRTGLASKKNDIYSYGVILLQLITGKEALSAHNGERLTQKASRILKDSSMVAEMLDSRLGFGYEGVDLEEAKDIASLSAMCLSETPSLRPSASDILEILRNRIDCISCLAAEKRNV
ncbi:hypothetical protein LIER_31104 [Lithospermum erythrorhizon]|uniref:non-specific serine/threonine protein kinase n=1 Tax=Lithospermum erythrorhizon TaxID=34254 RepID=A0AAV3RVT3_LITER